MIINIDTNLFSIEAMVGTALGILLSFLICSYYNSPTVASSPLHPIFD
jgi:uncharacterized membrane protein YgaE (UPF0421/DUF939 family)